VRLLQEVALLFIDFDGYVKLKSSLGNLFDRLLQSISDRSATVIWRYEMTEEKQCFKSSGNVFADLGLPNADELLIKAELAHQISELIEVQQLTQTATAELLGIDQPKVSALMRGKLSGFSVERLFRFLNALGNNVEIRIVPASQPGIPAQTNVMVG
jgi:predicted XRE-type DNA-binding protein